jgi:hypothetical protein
MAQAWSSIRRLGKVEAFLPEWCRLADTLTESKYRRRELRHKSMADGVMRSIRSDDGFEGSRSYRRVWPRRRLAQVSFKRSTGRGALNCDGGQQFSG